MESDCVGREGVEGVWGKPGFLGRTPRTIVGVDSVPGDHGL